MKLNVVAAWRGKVSSIELVVELNKMPSAKRVRETRAWIVHERPQRDLMRPECGEAT